MKSNILQSKDWELPRFTISKFSTRKNNYCVCIPIINEGERFKIQVSRMKQYSNLVDIIIADGGSTDGSTEEKFLKSNNVSVLLTKRSPGKQGTQLRMALAYALKKGYMGIITVDGNGKDDIHAIPKFIEALDKRYDCIAGSRFIKGGKAINTPFSRLVGIRFIASPLLSIAARHWYTDVTNGFMGYSSTYLLHPYVKPFRNIFVGYELLFYLNIRASQLGLKTTEIPVTREYPKKKIPTKIVGMKNQFNVLKTLLKIAIGHYTP